MQTTRIAIIGAGLAGLYAACLLEKKGIRDYLILEAKDLPGGRIASTSTYGNPGTEAVAGFDLGPTWFWPGFQPEMDRLVQDLGLVRFEQFETGELLLERSPDQPPVRARGYVNSPPSMRLTGGMNALLQALQQRLEATRIHTGQAVRRLRLSAPHIELETEDGEGRVSNWRARHVLLAMPPRLAEQQLDFAPALPRSLAGQWRDTATWMAPHAKYIALYDTPFWREQGLSGAAQSAVGPMAEIHDASLPDGPGALFGFLGIPAHVRKRLSEEELRSHCRNQFTRLFGPRAATPTAEFIKDWARDPFTATEADQAPSGQHPRAPATTADTGPWRKRLTGIASEWSLEFPGYLAGAIDAARRGVDDLC
ncbi:MAG: FAD-dependent oxidoreductase [Oleiphilaceae bacterium]|nr:FAD-dependent oxidoreductase [Oleiphilaceae bacterium]